MTFEIIVHREALKALLKLDRTLVQRIRNAIALLADNPRPHDCKKLIGFDDCFRVRVGAYRILYRIDDANGKVLVYRVAHRRESYR